MGKPDTDPDPDVDNSIPITPLNISSNPNDATTIHTLSDPTLGGLESGRTYYVVRDAMLPADTFRLALTPGGPAINLTYLPDPLASTRNQFIGSEGLDLLTSSGEQRLRIDLSGGLPVGTQQLLGAGGVAFSQVAPVLGNGISTVYANASSGGLVTVGINSSTLNVTQNVTASSLGHLTFAGDVTVQADSTTSNSAFVTNTSGGVIAVKTSTGTIGVINNTTARLGGVVTAGGDVTVLGRSVNGLSTTSRASGGAGIDIAAGTASSQVTPNTRVLVDPGARIRAGGALTFGASLGGNVQAAAIVQAAGLGSDADGDSTANVNNSTTEVRVGAGASVEGETARLFAEPSQLTLAAFTKTNAGGFGVDHDSDARANLIHQSQIFVDSLADLTGRSGVDLRARYGSVGVFATADGDTDAAFGTTDVNAIAIADAEALVFTVDNARVTAGPRLPGTPLSPTPVIALWPCSSRRTGRRSTRPPRS